jgi:hypothetical protein
MKIDGSCHCVRPARDIWRRSALSWVPDMDDLETHTGED